MENQKSIYNEKIFKKMKEYISEIQQYKSKIQQLNENIENEKRRVIIYEQYYILVKMENEDNDIDTLKKDLELNMKKLSKYLVRK